MELTLSKILNKVLPNDVKLQLKKEIEENLKMQEQQVIKASEYNLADGSKLKVDGDLAVNSKVEVVDATGVATPLNGQAEVMNEDGTITEITAVEGVITVLEPKQMEMTDEQKKAEEEKKKAEAANSNVMQQMSKQVSEIEYLKNENKELKETVKKNTESISLLLSVFKELENTPIDEEVVMSKKSYEDMTPAERYRYNKGL